MTLRVPRLSFSLDSLMAEAKRRARRRHLLLALAVVVVGAVAVTFALESGAGPGGVQSPSVTGSGNRLNPYPIGTPVSLNDPAKLGANNGWRMTVNSATINANAQVEAANGNVAPPAGHQYAVVNLTLTLLNNGPVQLKDFTMGRLLAETRKHAYLTHQCTAPSPDLTNAVTINSGQTETGNLCFPIFTTDASKLMLTAVDEVTNSNSRTAETRWFALH